MLKILLKKQLMEIFRNYFYDAKKNKKRSNSAVIAWFVLYGVMLCAIIGGTFSGMAMSLCPDMCEAGVNWLYFLIMSGLSIIMGVFGCVFSTYSSLYLSKDNDLLLSLPIPEKDIILSRLSGVYIMGALYSVIIMVPTCVIYWINSDYKVLTVIGSLLLMFIVTVVVFVLSCLLGFVVAKFSIKFKNKSFITVFVSLAVIVIYYICFYKAQAILVSITENAGTVGQAIKGSVYMLYMFGNIGTGDMLSALIYVVIFAALTVLVWTVISKTFVKIVQYSSVTEKVKSTGKAIGVKSPFAALVAKELARFKSSPNYMLNCGMGVFFIPCIGIFFLIKGGDICNALAGSFSEFPNAVCIIVCAVLFTLSSMNNMVTPSVSLEGKSLWIPQSLPVNPQTILRAKLTFHIILTGIPMIFAVICALVVCKPGIVIGILMFAAAAVFILFSALFDLLLGVSMANVMWSNEIIPIKQSFSVGLALFGGWGVAAVFAVVYFLGGAKIGTGLYLGLFTLLMVPAILFIWRWIETKGARKFSEL